MHELLERLANSAENVWAIGASLPEQTPLLRIHKALTKIGTMQGRIVEELDDALQKRSLKHQHTPSVPKDHLCHLDPFEVALVGVMEYSERMKKCATRYEHVLKEHRPPCFDMIMNIYDEQSKLLMELSHEANKSYSGLRDLLII